MSTDVMSTALRPRLSPRPARTRLRLEHVVMGAAIVSLIVLVVLPLAFLLIGSFKGSSGVTLDAYSEVLTGRLYVNALKNSLILGAWSGLFSLLIGLPLAWAVARTDVPAKPLFQITATLSYLSPPFLTAIALTYLFSPNAGLSNVLMRDVLGLPWLTFNIFTMPGLVLVTVMHTFPFVYLLASSALQSVDASYEEAAQILGASKLRTAFSITAPLVAPAVLSGTLLAFVNAIALFGSQAIIGLPGRIVTLPTRIYALFDYPPEYALASALSLVFIVITVAALYLQNAFLKRRSYVTLGGKGSRPQMMRLGVFRWILLGFVIAVFFVSIVLPYATLIAVSFSKSWGLEFWKNLTLANYKFVLFEYNVTQRAIMNSLFLAFVAATFAVLLGAVIGWIDLRTRIPGRKAARLRLADPARAARHRDGGGADPVLAGDAARALRHADDPAARLCRPLHPARRARRQCLAAPGRPFAGGERADPRRQLDHDHARDHAAADPARPVRRLAPGVRAGDPGAVGVDPAVLVAVDHAGGRGLQSLRDRLYRAGGGARDDQHVHHRRRDLARLSPRRPQHRLAHRSRAGADVEHDPEKWEPVFGQDHAQSNKFNRVE